MKVAFYLNSSSIYVNFAWSGNRLQQSTGIAIDPAHWNDNPTKRKPDLVLAPEHAMKHKNKKLKDIESWAIDLYYQNDQVTKQELKTAFLETWRGKKREVVYVAPKTFLEIFDEWIEESKSKITGRGVISPATITNYKKCRRALANFEKTKHMPVNFKGMDLKFYAKFRAYCLQDLEYSINTFGQRIQTLKSFLKECIKNDIEVNPKWVFFEVPQHYKGVEFLTVDQLEDIKKITDLKTDKSSLELSLYCRDIFLFQCYTALRISDVFRLRKSDIKGDRIFLPDSQKTGNPVVIPYLDNLAFQPVHIVKKHQNATEYLFIWRGKALPDVKNVDTIMNLVLNEITTAIKCPFKITTKTGRKTFATYAIAILKMNKADVMRITGHTTEKSFNRYMGFDADAVIEAYREKAKFLKVS